MSASSVSLFALPWFLAKKVMANIDPYNLFVLSTLSKRSKRFVETYSKLREFVMAFRLDTHTNLVIIENAGSNDLNIEFIEKTQAPTSALEFCQRVFSVCFIPERKTIQLVGTELEESIPFMLEYVCDLVRVNEIDITHRLKDKKLTKTVNEVVNKLQLKIMSYLDLQNEYDQKEVKELMNIQMIILRKAKLPVIELRELFLNWINGSKTTFMSLECSSEDSDAASIQIIQKLVKTESTIRNNRFESSLEFKKNDGRTAFVSCQSGLVLFQIKNF